MASLLAWIPPVNTVIVAIVGLLILAGVRRIRRGEVEAHKRRMLAATGLFALFLALYLTRLILHGPTSFADQNPQAPAWAAGFYYTFLGVHMVLALVRVVLIPLVLTRAFRGDFEAHRRLARWTAPLWLVSIVMGIGVYFLLFQVWA